MKDKLISNLDKIKTTPLGVERIKKNLNIDCSDVIGYCKELIQSELSIVYKKGKNYYCIVNNYCLTINSYSYTIITVHLI